MQERCIRTVDIGAFRTLFGDKPFCTAFVFEFRPYGLSGKTCPVDSNGRSNARAREILIVGSGSAARVSRGQRNHSQSGPEEMCPRRTVNRNWSAKRRRPRGIRLLSKRSRRLGESDEYPNLRGKLRARASKTGSVLS